MYFDQWQMPCQRNGDVGDSCQRVGWIESINQLRKSIGLEEAQTPLVFPEALKLLEVKPGLYVRHPHPLPENPWQMDPHQFSRDQQSALRKALIFRRDGKVLWRMFKAHALRGFKYQNSDWGMALDEYLRGFILCAGWISYPLVPFIWAALNVFDLSGLFTALMVCGKLPRWKHETKSFVAFEADHTSDDLNLLLDLALYSNLQSVAGYIAHVVYKNRPQASNSGIEKNNIQGALASYFRESEGGNPFLAEMARPVVEAYFG